MDDTLSGDDMTAAQQHLLVCSKCAAHDTLVRRALILARNVPALEPSAGFEERLEQRLRECLSECRGEPAEMPGHAGWHFLRTGAAVAAAALVVGVILWQGTTPVVAPQGDKRPVVALEPTPPAFAPSLAFPSTVMPVPLRLPEVSPALVRAMATGNPVWPAAMMLDQVPTHLINASYGFTE